MVSKENLLNLGFFAMVVLISSEVTARDLAKASSISTMAGVVKGQKDASSVTYDKHTCTGDHDHHNCFFGGMPGIPGVPGMPGMPGGGDMPGMPGGGGTTPGMPGGGSSTTPGMPGTLGGGYGGLGGPGVKGYHGGLS